MCNVANFIENNKEIIPSAVSAFGLVFTVIIAIVGWFVSSHLNKKQLQNNAKMKIYREICSLEKIYMNCALKLNVALCNKSFGAANNYAEYIGKLIEKNDEWHKAYRNLLDYLKIWESLMPDLQNAKNELFCNQFEIIGKEIDGYCKRLVKNLIEKTIGQNKRDIEEKREELGKLHLKIAVCFEEDFMVLVHNTLVGSIIGNKKNKSGVTVLPSEYELLTKKGIKLVKNKKINFFKKPWKQ